jgi:membrane protein DedA with SNARE-associated domain
VPDSLLETLYAYAGDPWIVAVLLSGATFILEDPATVGGAILSSEGVIHPMGALAALYVGIVLGDLGLYGLGWLGARNRRVQHFLEHKRVAKAGAWMGERLIGTIVTSRFIPGMRLPVYTACGLFGLSFKRFVLTVLVAVAVWTTVLFYAIYYFGVAVMEDLGAWRWAVAAGLVIAIILLPRLVRRLVGTRRLPETETPDFDAPDLPHPDSRRTQA